MIELFKALYFAVKPVRSMSDSGEIARVFADNGGAWHCRVLLDVVNCEEACGGAVKALESASILNEARSTWASHLETMCKLLEDSCPPWELERNKDIAESLGSFSM